MTMEQKIKIQSFTYNEPEYVEIKSAGPNSTTAYRDLTPAQTSF